MRRKQPDTQPRKKKQIVNTSRIVASPSPVKNSIHLTSQSIEEEQTEDEKTIVIKKSQLVLFTRKFALEKIEFEEMLEDLKKENQVLRRRIQEIEVEMEEKASKQGYEANRRSIDNRLITSAIDGNRTSQINRLIQQLSQSQIQMAQQKQLAQKQLLSLQQQNQKYSQLLIQKSNQYLHKEREVLDLKSQLNKAQHLYSKIKTQVSELRVAELEKVRESLCEKSMIDQSERVRALECDVARLKNLNELFRTQLKNEENEIKEKNELIDELQNQIYTLEESMENLDNSMYGDKNSEKRIEMLEIEVEHLSNQLFLEKANNRKLVDLQFKYNELRSQLSSKNNTIVTLTSQLSHQNMSNNKMLVSKCQQLQTHIQRLNKIIIQQKLHSETSSLEIQKHLKYKQNSQELQQYKKKYTEMLESIKNLQNSDNEQSQKFPPLEDLMNQLEENPSRTRLMENIISGLRSENNELKSVIENDGNSLNYDAQNQLREIIYEMTKVKMEKEEENDTLRWKIDELNYQIEKLRAGRGGIGEVNQSTRTFNRSVEKVKRGRLGRLLRKIGECSKEIVLPGEDASIEGDVYELIIGKLMGHIENLEDSKGGNSFNAQGHSHSHGYSYSLQH